MLKQLSTAISKPVKREASFVSGFIRTFHVSRFTFYVSPLTNNKTAACSRTSPARARNESVERIKAHSYRSHEIGTARKQLAHGIFRSRHRSSLAEARSLIRREKTILFPVLEPTRTTPPLFSWLTSNWLSAIIRTSSLFFPWNLHVAYVIRLHYFVAQR